MSTARMRWCSYGSHDVRLPGRRDISCCSCSTVVVPLGASNAGIELIDLLPSLWCAEVVMVVMTVAAGYSSWSW